MASLSCSNIACRFRAGEDKIIGADAGAIAVDAAGVITGATAGAHTNSVMDLWVKVLDDFNVDGSIHLSILSRVEILLQCLGSP